MNQKLYIFTGKGGVGKTSCALAFASYLHNKSELIHSTDLRGKKVFYLVYDQPLNLKIAQDLGIPSLDFSFDESAEAYLYLKLKSKILAKWISSSSFFQSLCSIVPSIASLIFLGHLVHKLQEDPSLVVILDAPATGHALNFLSSSFFFKNLFKKGPLFDDIVQMHQFLLEEKKLKLFILAIPTELSLMEAYDFGLTLKDFSHLNNYFILNNSLSALINSDHNIKQGLKRETYPEWLQIKILSEQKCLDNFPLKIDITIPHISLPLLTNILITEEEQALNLKSIKIFSENEQLMDQLCQI